MDDNIGVGLWKVVTSNCGKQVTHFGSLKWQDGIDDQYTPGEIHVVAGQLTLQKKITSSGSIKFRIVYEGYFTSDMDTLVMGSIMIPSLGWYVTTKGFKTKNYKLTESTTRAINIGFTYDQPLHYIHIFLPSRESDESSNLSQVFLSGINHAESTHTIDPHVSTTSKSISRLLYINFEDPVIAVYHSDVY